MNENDEIIRIDWFHKAIHDGDVFQVFFEDITLNDNDTINFAFKTPALTIAEIHMIIEYSTEVGGQLTVLEAANWTPQAGTIKVPINMNRNSSKTSKILGNETATAFAANELAYNVATVLTTNATTVESDAVYINGTARGLWELILKADTKYVVLFTAEGASNFAHLKLRWNEYLP